MIKLVNKFLGNFNIRLIKLMNIKELERNNNFLKNEKNQLKKDFLFFQRTFKRKKLRISIINHVLSWIKIYLF